jgi:hypothetical protein
MKTIQIPHFLHEVFGKKSTLVELSLILVTSTGATLALFWATYEEWSSVEIWKTILLVLLIFDIMAGFVANLTFSTNDYYRAAPKSRLVFILLHVQPLVFSALLGS